MTTELADHRQLFDRFLTARPERLHVAAHSHHPWPDVSLEAHCRAWHDAAAHHDDKWDVILGGLLPAVQGHLARLLGSPDPTAIVVSPNTHDLAVRVLSCLPRPARVLTTDAEFHSFTRQARRLAESGAITLDVVAAEPHRDLPERLAAAAGGDHDLVWISHVHFDSGWVLDDLGALVAAVPADTWVVVDGYHAVGALPVDISGLADRIFYIGGGYKYLMAGEGAAFMHCPPGWGPRPEITGWWATFGDLTAGVADEVAYPDDGWRFAGATFDPSGLYRLDAVQRMWTAQGITPAAVRQHVTTLQARFMEAAAHLDLGELLPVAGEPRGSFLTFRRADAGALREALADDIDGSDHRDDRLRLGFGIYHVTDDVDELVARLQRVLG